MHDSHSVPELLKTDFTGAPIETPFKKNYWNEKAWRLAPRSRELLRLTVSGRAVFSAKKLSVRLVWICESAASAAVDSLGCWRRSPWQTSPEQKAERSLELAGQLVLLNSWCPNSQIDLVSKIKYKVENNRSYPTLTSGLHPHPPDTHTTYTQFKRTQ